MEEVESTKPIDLQWLVDCLPRDKSAEHSEQDYLETFWRNVLYYPRIAQTQKPHASVVSILTTGVPSIDFKDDEMTKTPGGTVTSHVALYAMEHTLIINCTWRCWELLLTVAYTCSAKSRVKFTPKAETRSCH